MPGYLERIASGGAPVFGRELENFQPLDGCCSGHGVNHAQFRRPIKTFYPITYVLNSHDNPSKVDCHMFMDLSNGQSRLVTPLNPALGAAQPVNTRAKTPRHPRIRNPFGSYNADKLACAGTVTPPTSMANSPSAKYAASTPSACLT